MEGKLRQEHQIEPWQIRRLNVKGKLEILLQDGSTTSIPLEELEACVRPGCHVCTDLTAVDADISAGAIGSPEGFTTLIVRNDTGRGFIDSAVRHGRLATGNEINTKIIERLAGQKAARKP